MYIGHQTVSNQFYLTVSKICNHTLDRAFIQKETVSKAFIVYI